MGCADVERQFVAEAMEDVDAILLDVVGHSPYTPDGPYLAPDAFGWKMQGELLQRGYLSEIGHAMRLRGIQMVRIAGELLRQYSPSDLFPAFIRKNYVQPYALKALPCVLIWFKLVYEMMTKDYSTPQNVSEEK